MRDAVPVGYDQVQLCPVFDGIEVTAAWAVDSVEPNGEEGEPDMTRCPAGLRQRFPVHGCLCLSISGFLDRQPVP
jgi:hypothetical protein